MESRELSKQLVDKFVKSFGEYETNYDEMFYNESKSTGINLLSFLEDLAEDVLDYKNKSLLDEIEAQKSRISELEKDNENLLMKPSNSEIMFWENEEHLRTLKISFLELLKRITYTEEEKEKYFEVECDCGFKGLSFLLLGGGQIADTGDYGDCYCPCCNEIID